MHLNPSASIPARTTDPDALVRPRCFRSQLVLHTHWEPKPGLIFGGMSEVYVSEQEEKKQHNLHKK